jgi:hypothetical protein
MGLRAATTGSASRDAEGLILTLSIFRCICNIFLNINAMFQKKVISGGAILDPNKQRPKNIVICVMQPDTNDLNQTRFKAKIRRAKDAVSGLAKVVRAKRCLGKL